MLYCRQLDFSLFVEDVSPHQFRVVEASGIRGDANLLCTIVALGILDKC